MVRGPDATHSAVLHEMVGEIKAEFAAVLKRWDADDREVVYHYTTINAAYEILKDRVLWSSDVLSMNDGSEFRYAVSIVDEVLMHRWNVLPIHVAEYFRPKKLLRIGSTWSMFAACFCSEPDLLSQWRAYGSASQGVAIGFEVRPLHDFGRRSNEFGLVPIHYSSGELRDETQNICDLALRLVGSRVLPYDESEIFWCEVALVLLNFAIRFKNPSFIDEREWRALTVDAGALEVFCRGSGEQKRRYVHIHLLAETVSRIVLGPLASADAASNLRTFLDNHNLKHVGIARSAIPLRATA
jgi:hypothetical protein